MNALTSVDLAAIRALAEKATPGPWEIGEDGPPNARGYGGYLYSLHVYALDPKDLPEDEESWTGITWCNCSEDGAQDCRGPKLNRARHNAAFIAASREAVPALCTELEAAWARIEEKDARIAELEQQLEKIGS